MCLFCHKDVITLSALLAFCEGNTSVTIWGGGGGGGGLQTASNRERVVEQTVELSVISDVMTLLWRHWLCRWWDKIKISFLTIPWFQE